MSRELENSVWTCEGIVDYWDYLPWSLKGVSKGIIHLVPSAQPPSLHYVPQQVEDETAAGS